MVGWGVGCGVWMIWSADIYHTVPLTFDLICNPPKIGSLETSNWQHTKILDIGRDMAIHWGAQLIGINDYVLFKLDEI